MDSNYCAHAAVPGGMDIQKPEQQPFENKKSPNLWRLFCRLCRRGSWLCKVVIPEVKEPAGITIRQAVKGDNEYLASLSDVIFRALANPPYWHPTVPEDWDELREGWAELADDKEWTVWLALEKDEALGTVGFRPEWEEDTQMLASPRPIYLSVAATKPQACGRGLSTILTWHGLEQARKERYEICYTNWISPNLLASRFWPRFGFKDVAHRLAKKVDPSIAWTRGSSSS
jgi:hypothetical protein